MTRLLAPLLASLVLAACGTTEETPGTDVGTDGVDQDGGDTTADSDNDTVEDTEPDSEDTEPDVPGDTTEPDTIEPDTEPDVLPDTDAGDDTATDTPDDTAPDAPEDTANDSGDDADAGLPCSEGPLVCDMLEPVCETGLIAAVQDGCWVCVDPDTCRPLPTYCEHPSVCDRAEWCNPCGTSSCPDCTDCVSICVPHTCDDPTDLLTCRMLRPECPRGQISVVRDGCWECVELATCQPPPRSTQCEELGGYCVGAGAFCRLNYNTAPALYGCDAREQCCVPVGTPLPRDCNDGSEPLCDRIPPVCTEFEVMAVIDGCEQCVNPATCLPWGTAECGREGRCDRGWECNLCGTSSCPFCDDCLGACVPAM